MNFRQSRQMRWTVLSASALMLVSASAFASIYMQCVGCGWGFIGTAYTTYTTAAEYRWSAFGTIVYYPPVTNVPNTSAQAFFCEFGGPIAIVDAYDGSGTWIDWGADYACD